MAGRRSVSRRALTGLLAAGLTCLCAASSAQASVPEATPSTLGGAPPSPSGPPVFPSAQDVARSKAHVATTASAISALEGRIAVADAHEARLQDQAQQAAEAYNGAVYRLAEAKVAAQQAHDKADAAQAEADSAREDIGRLAAASYRSGGTLSELSMVLSSNGLSELLERMSSMEALARNQTGSLDRLTVSTIVARVLRGRADAAFAARTEALAAVSKARTAAEAAVAAQRAASAALAATRSSMLRQLASLRRTTVALEQAREHGLAVAKARREAEARAAALRREAARAVAARRARAVDSGSGGSGDPSALSAPTSRATSGGGAAAVAYARAQLGKPYEWAAVGPATFDCSGLTMMAWAQSGVGLGHWTVAQYEQSRSVSVGQARPGDLVFFATDFTDIQTIHHVGLYVGGGQMIEAPYTGADVRVSSIYRPDFYAMGRP